MKKQNEKADSKNFDIERDHCESCPFLIPTSSEHVAAGNGGDDKEMKRCSECIIGVLNYDGQTKLATVPILLDHIKRRREMRNLYTNNKAKVMFGDLVDAPKAYTLSDYCTGKHTDMFRFTCCPRCGEPINYRDIFDKYIDV